VLKQLKASGELPLRITHNDTKCNNVLFDDQFKATCVIDLDTVMPGLIHYDFSDAIRTATTVHEEGERDINLVRINMEALENFSKGFVSQVRPFATARELAMLAPTIGYMPYLLGLRFLNDHLNGDTYFKTEYHGQNLVRARNQFRFVELLESHANQIQDCIGELSQQSIQG
jgi:Ser/Thr protein kinase RdoA (MazF antagonist)